MSTKRGMLWAAGGVALLLSLAYPGYAQTPKYVPGEVIVKLRNINAKFSPKLKSGVLKTEIFSLDKLNEKFKVSEMTHVFKGVKEPTTFSYSKQKASYVSVPDMFPIFKVRFPKETNVMQVVSAYKSDPNVTWAEPNYIVYLKGLTPSEGSTSPKFSDQWALNNTGQTGGTPDADVDAPEAWEIQTSNSEVIVAVVDTGVNYDHPDLTDNMWINPNPGSYGDLQNDVIGYDFCADDDDPMDEDGHGTHVAGIIGAVTNNNEGVAGMNYKNTTKIMALRVLCDSTTTYPFPPPPFADQPIGDLVTTSAAIVYAADHGAKVISNSWGCKVECDGSCPFDANDLNILAIDYADKKGAVNVFAAGNESCEVQNYPEGYEKVISVAATDHKDTKASYSHYGTWVDIAAPGGDGANDGTDKKDICSTWLNGGDGINADYACINGTSMATPVVSGVVALIFSQHDNWSAQQVKDKLLASVDPIDSLNTTTCNGASCAGKLGTGRLNAYKALLDLPSAPANLTAVAGNTQISLSWTSATQGTYAISGYNVYRSTTSQSYTSANKIATVNSTTTSYADTSVTNGTTYYYVVRAVDALNNESGDSSEKSASPFVPPSNPTGLTATATSTQATLSWTAAVKTTYAISGYNVYRSATSGSGYAKINSSVVTTTTYADTTISSNTAYYYVVRALDAQSNESGNSNEASVTIPPPVVTVVDPPAKGDGYVTLTWNTVSGATSYNLYMASQSGVTKTNYSTLADGMKHTGVTSPYIHTGLTNGKAYYFAVTAVSASGESDESAPVTATPYAVPSAPTNLSASASGTTATLTWTAATATTYPISSYNIYRSTTAGSGYAKINTSTVTGTTYIENSATSSGTYYYVVRAVDTQGYESANSSEVPMTIFSHTFPAGVSMMAIPLSFSSSTTAASLFSDDSGLNVARWDANKNAYDKYTDNSVSSNLILTQGNGYWLKLTAQKILNMLTPGSPSQNVEASIVKGWNQIANPFITKDYFWAKVGVKLNGETKILSDAVTADWLGSYAWYYPDQTSGYQLTHPTLPTAASQVLQPFYGYWIYSAINGTLVFYADKLNVPAVKFAEDTTAGTLLSVQIKASTATSSDVGNYFGVSKARSNETVQKPPDALEGGRLKAYFVRNGKQSAYDFHASASQKEQVWDFVVECDGTQNITLSWDASVLPPGARLFIQDTVTGSVTDMSAQKSVSVSVGGQKTFKIKYYKPDVLSQNNGEASLFVTRPFMYPNPDKTGNATFRYVTSPAVVRMTIEVYNIAGKLIEKFEGNLNGESKWLFGDRVAAGVYLYRITAYAADGKESVIGKVVVVR